MQPLKTDRLTLRPFTLDDVTAAFGFFGDREVMRFSLNGPHASRKTTEDFITANINRQARLGFSIWAVIEAATGDIIGMCGLAEFGHGVPGIELAYRLRRDRWGRGYGTEAGQAAVAHAFGPRGLDRLIAAVERENTPSIHVLEKCGFGFVEERTIAGRDALVYETLSSTGPHRSTSTG
ncbi:MAG: GNAT family N-acetyltransferase [Proteobacteria bacterium]|nr:GNAT family N-acetyltransferase [Pseudomonadota bacterium]